MFNFFTKKPNGDVLKLNITGMHCTSCAMNIDGLLEELYGVVSSSTSYAKAKVEVVFQAEKVSKQQILDELKKLEYTFSVIE